MLLLLLSAVIVDAALERAAFAEEAVRYVIADYESGRVVAERWDEPAAPIAPGSLWKPFLAVAALGPGAVEPAPQNCDGSRCWLPGGHGTVGLRRALAESCNAYFRAVALRMDAAPVGATAARFGLPPPPAGTSADGLWGLSPEWRASPLRLLAGYAELVKRRAEPAAAVVLGGLRDAARSGTAAGVGRALPLESFAKTGTAACAHPRGGEADGYAVAIYPAEKPRYTIVVQIHGRTGRRAAEAAGTALRAWLSR